MNRHVHPRPAANAPRLPSIPEGSMASNEAPHVPLPPSPPPPAPPGPSRAGSVGPAQMNVHGNGHEKLPLYHGTSADTMPAKTWIERVYRTGVSNNWSENQTLNYAINALRDEAINWYESDKIRDGLDNWTNFRIKFTKLFHKTSTENSMAHIKRLVVKRQQNETILAFYNRVCREMDAINDLIPESAAPDQPHQLQPRSVRSLPGYHDITVPVLQETWQRAFQQRQHDICEFYTMNFFFAGLDTKLQWHLSLKRYTDVLQMRDDAIKYEEIEGIHNHRVDAVQQGQRPRSAPAKRQWTGPASKDRKASFECFYCSKKGHSQKECRKRIRENGALKAPPKKVNEVEEQEDQNSSQKVNSFHLNF